ncbi:PucR family transcriptional regulator [Microbispora corallina]|uniref:PucR family transcriptional regulator n=1 Tax=Microbispora corallina TaxID=83302 RepID=A0ABQ4FSM8_9ACTN|nr:PucR family transcriptional regulator [Microbispora corallina]GIH37826.1 PucR family transcriptional regulator [Microbispora corallina]
MAPTLRRVTAMAPLHLEVLAGAGALDRPVRWVAVSELEDPTPFLEGGELVLTTGMRLTGAGAAAYVSRLMARGAAGLGFGVGLGHDAVPPELLEAAAAAGLPLLEVPRDTPFIAIGKAVSELLAAEQYEEIRRAFAAQGRLTRAALRREGTAGVIGRLAKEIGGWALLLDDTGAVRHAAGREGEQGWAEAVARALEPELARLRGAPSLASLALSTPGEHVVVQPLGRRGFFAVGSSRPFSPIAHTVVNAAGSLLTLALEQGREQRAAAARARTAVLRLLLAGQAEAAAETLEALGGRLPREPVSVLACETADADALAEALPCFTAPWEDLLVALVPEEEADRHAARAARHGRVGVSAPGVVLGRPPGGEPRGTGLSTGLDQARRALVSAAPVARFADLAGQGLLSLIDPAAAASFAAALLAPLREYGSRADLVESLRAYLASNGHWDAAAQRLGVHRHTLRYRMRRVAELLGRDLDDPAARAELWIALCL